MMYGFRRSQIRVWQSRVSALSRSLFNIFIFPQIHMDTPSGWKDSIPAWIKFAVQAPGEIPYNGIYYDPPEEVSCCAQVWNLV